MSVLKIAFIISFSLIQLNAYAAETDQFTRRDEFLADSGPLLNIKANEAIDKAIKIANSEGNGCVEEDLYKELREFYGNHSSGEINRDILTNPNFSIRSVEVKDSVYQDWTAWDGIGLVIPFLKNLTMAGVIRVGDQTIGTDKLEHMFGQGFKYFTKNYLDGKGEIAAVKAGIIREKFILGGFKIESGVFSYGDLSANFNGMRLWNHMLQLRPDVLGESYNIGPYISCEKNKWVHVKQIDFKNYIDDSMDEAINCSKFPTQNTTDKFEERLKIMGMSCPLDRTRLQAINTKYGYMSKWIINLDGSAKVKFTGEFKNK